MQLAPASQGFELAQYNSIALVEDTERYVTRFELGLLEGQFKIRYAK